MTACLDQFDRAQRIMVAGRRELGCVDAAGRDVRAKVEPVLREPAALPRDAIDLAQVRDRDPEVIGHELTVYSCRLFSPNHRQLSALTMPVPNTTGRSTPASATGSSCCFAASGFGTFGFGMST